MYHTTGLSRESIVDLCAIVNGDVADAERTWPPILGLFKSVVVTLTYLRRNRVQAEIGEAFGVSQSTISRAIAALTPLLDAALRRFVPTADDLDDTAQYVVDGTLLPCRSWASHPQLYSGKHKTTGMNVQVAATLDGQLAWISDCGCRIGHLCHAAWAYSWISPPSLSRRWTRGSDDDVAGGSGLSGAACFSARWGRWWLK
jgi:hypothetical protein